MCENVMNIRDETGQVSHSRRTEISGGQAMLRGNVELTLNVRSRDVVLVVLHQRTHDGGLHYGVARSWQSKLFNFRIFLLYNYCFYLNRQKLSRSSTKQEGQWLLDRQTVESTRPWRNKLEINNCLKIKSYKVLTFKPRPNMHCVKALASESCEP